MNEHPNEFLQMIVSPILVSFRLLGMSVSGAAN